MSTTFNLTERDHRVLEALVIKVRLFSLRQVSGHWWDDQIANTRRRMKVLARAGLVHRMTVTARPLPALDHPVCMWKPGLTAADFGSVAYRLERRWHQRPLRQQTAIIATDRAAQLFGGKGRGQLKCAAQATHDLGVAAVWLHLDNHAQAWARAWQGEDLLAATRRGEKLPDAFILDPTGQTRWVIEFGGSYNAARVAAFHADCARRGLPYQIW